jgi:putative membrane-bound dehydrogenase-like protein
MKNKQNIFCTSAVFFTMLLFSCNNDSNNKPQEPVDTRITKMDPEQVAQMAQSIESRINPEIKEGLSLSLWGVDSLVFDPISIDIDNQGRIYYTRTNRQKNSEFDIRGHQDWEIESISLQTIEDKRKFLRKVLSPENSDNNQWLPDLNGDGSHDWKDMTIEKEHVYRLEDTSGDGRADQYQLMAEDFNDEVTDVAGAILSHGNDVFVGAGPDLWRLKDSNGDGIMDDKTSLSHGYGIHIGFGGHGMSGLKMGPDGKIYWGIGDIGFNGTGDDGTKWEYPNRGVIARANPDGSDFEIFAMGVRNTHEFVFDEYGNLISHDNDGDHEGEKERLVYLVNGSDTGWRINWQFGKYRDPDNNTYKVWMDEGLWKPRFDGQAAYITPTIANFVSGPTGMAYYPGTAWSPEWKNTFFIVEFVGNPARSGIHSFKLKPKGATFELGEHEMILSGVLATGIDFGPDGAMYVADWIEGWGTKDFGRIWKLDAPGGASNPERQQTQTLLAEDFKGHNEAHLSGLLKHPDMRVRQKAQFELAIRGEKGAEAFQNNINQTENQLARVHGIWGMSQLARKDKQYAKSLLPLLQDNDPEIRSQAAKWLGDIRYKEAGSALIPLLKDENSRARFFAAEALGRIAYEPATNGLIALLEANNDEDAYLRHAASLALARIGKADPVVALSSHASRAVRMGAVLALRRMSHAGITNFLNDADEYIVTEAARAINDDFSIEPALPALGNILQNKRFTQEPLIRRAINANLRVGTDQALQNLINYSLQDGNPVAMRAEAIEAISTWTKPSVLDRVDGRYRGTIERDPAPVQNVVSAPLVQLSNHRNATLRLSTVKAIGKLKIDQGAPRLFALLKTDGNPEVREASLRSLAAMEHKDIGNAIEQALSDREKSVRVAGLDLMGSLDISKDLMVSLLAEVIEKRSTEEKQAALVTLGTVPVEHSKGTFENLINRMANGNLSPEIHLELGEAVTTTKSPELQKRLDGVRSKISPDITMASYQDALFGGNQQQGRELAFKHQSANCMKCHSFNDYGGTAGPGFNGIGKRLSRQELLEALIDPSKRIAPGFGVVVLDLNTNKTVSGILQEENDNSLSVKIGSRADTVILKEHITKRIDAGSSMPDMKNFLTKREIRDLVSFLATLQDEEGQARRNQETGHGTQ